jgi:hypothetical protein
MKLVNEVRFLLETITDDPERNERCIRKLESVAKQIFELREILRTNVPDGVMDMLDNIVAQFE